jgi:hypothetical protein
MTTTCECGMLHDQRAQQSDCQECGTTVCRSCALEIQDTTYCRWCATSLAASA